MSTDDEIAVVKSKGRWYVGWVGGGNIEYAILEGSSFDDLDAALSYAHAINNGTEYGVRVYGKR